ncbi:YebC/PmpR family DNA-binding transcriptional regulator [Marinicella litoralis]|uniref:Probable transcriptional regulatory protein C8D91_0498 n=1 Tax=Marinicella litoralis TaxID=644220 RepID=A0A4R6XZ73_9GAMM|nr:YebC/PmpR family DNA-binding transcriptional regulator [Marinicella litoralis]TDR23634.1 YebC/PmpR family DNA-binding regulatory protein [Marinicella litoralis]
MGRAYQNRKESMAKTSDANARVYSKFSREIYVCAKSGGADPDANLALRSLLDRAKKSQVPAHVIKNALDKSQGAGGEDFAVARYEGYGPGGCMVIVDCLTDNPNRTFGDVRLCFTKTDCKIGTQGTVLHMFDHAAILVFAGDDEDAALEVLMDADVDVTDIESEDGKLTVFAPQIEYFKAKQALQDAFPDIDFDVDEIQFIPQSTAPIAEEDIPNFNKFIDMLDELDDVQNVYHNAEL